MRFFAPLLVGVAGAFALGLADYETTSVWQLFEGENFPFMIVLTVAIGMTAFLMQESVRFVARKLRQP